MKKADSNGPRDMRKWLSRVNSQLSEKLRERTGNATGPSVSAPASLAPSASSSPGTSVPSTPTLPDSPTGSDNRESYGKERHRHAIHMSLVQEAIARERAGGDIMANLSEKEFEWLSKMRTGGGGPSYERLRLFVGTWNVNSQMPTEDLRPWLFQNCRVSFEPSVCTIRRSEPMEKGPDLSVGALKGPDLNIGGLSITDAPQATTEPESSSESTDSGVDTTKLRPLSDDLADNSIDVYAIGLQEVDMTAQAMLKKETSASQAWLDGIHDTLGRDRYTLIAVRQLVGLLLLVFAEKDTAARINDVRIGSVKCGFMGKVGNKGAVGVSFKLDGTMFCFITAHLAAHQNEIAKRNADYQEIQKQMRFRKPPVPPTSISPLADQALEAASSDSGTKIHEHNVVYWFGDLNYRIGMQNHVVRKWIGSKLYNDLLKYDQLLEEWRKGRVFDTTYREADITFPPTYRFDVGTSNYDTSEKRRTPAYCDRIIWRGNGVDQIAYNCTNLLLSDHKPVYGIFEVNTYLTSQTRQRFRHRIRSNDLSGKLPKLPARSSQS